MKTRMATGRCCCGAEPCVDCDPTETSWSDDFSTYSTGEDLTAYGYVHAFPFGTVTESAGRMLISSGLYSANAYRPYKIPFCRVQEISFSVSNQGQASMSLIGIAFSGNIIDTLGVSWTASSYQAVWADSGGTQAQTYSATINTGDIIKVILTGISHNVDGIFHVLSGTANFYHNAALIASKYFESKKGEGSWCDTHYGVMGTTFTDTLTDDWEFNLIY